MFGTLFHGIMMTDPFKVKLQICVGFAGQLYELNRLLRGRAIRCNVTKGLSDGIIPNKTHVSL